MAGIGFLTERNYFKKTENIRNIVGVSLIWGVLYYTLSLSAYLLYVDPLFYQFI